MGAYAGVAGMLQESAQSMKLPTASKKPSGPLGSGNLFSFVPTAKANTNAPPSSTPTNAAAAAAGGPEAAATSPSNSGAATAPSSTPGAADGTGTEEAATAAASVASALASVLASGAGAGVFGGGDGGATSREAGLGLGLEAGDYWETGVLDGSGAGGGAGVEALDETSLRMEMKTSMDMHRLMRSRQKVWECSRLVGGGWFLRVGLARLIPGDACA